MRGFHGATCASRSSRCTHVGLVEQKQQCFTFDSFNTEVSHARHAVFARHGFEHVWQCGNDVVYKSVAQLGDSLIFVGTSDVGEMQCSCSANNAGDVVRATSPVALLATTKDHWLELFAGFQHHNANTFWSTKFVRRQRQCINERSDFTQVKPTCCLHGIGVKQSVRCMLSHDASNVAHWCDRANFVIDCHH